MTPNQRRRLGRVVRRVEGLPGQTGRDQRPPRGYAPDVLALELGADLNPGSTATATEISTSLTYTVKDWIGAIPTGKKLPSGSKVLAAIVDSLNTDGTTVILLQGVCAT